MELIRNWWNKGRNYFEGVAILSDYIDDKDLLQLLANGESVHKRKRLETELLGILEKTKTSTENDQPIPVTLIPITKPLLRKRPTGNNPLYLAAYNEAMNTYKANQNKRAQLFAMAQPKDFSDMNLTERIAERRALALEVVKGYQLASELFDRADYVRDNGWLPDTETEEANLTLIPDELVYQTLNNRRKALSKLKKKETTADRIAKIQEHETVIAELAKRWKKLKN